MSTPTQQGTLSVNGVELYYEACGNGHPLVFLHGNGEDGRIFAPQVSAFRDSYRVITLDSRGHGQSTLGKPPLTLSDMADDLAEALRQLVSEPVHLVGFSDGGNVALLYALKHHKMLRSLTLVGANLSPRGVKLGMQLPIWLGYACRSLFAPFSRQARHKQNILRLMVNQPHIDPQLLVDIDTPTLVVAGEHDMIKPQHTQLLFESLPHARLAIVPKADHFLMFKQAEVFNGLLGEFLAVTCHT